MKALILTLLLVSFAGVVSASELGEHDGVFKCEATHSSQAREEGKDIEEESGSQVEEVKSVDSI